MQGQLVITGSRSPTQQGRCADVMFQQVLQAVQAVTGSSAISYLSLSVLQVCGGGLSVLSVVRLVLGAFQQDCVIVFVGSTEESCCETSIPFKCCSSLFIITMETRTMLKSMVVARTIVAKDLKTIQCNQIH